MSSDGATTTPCPPIIQVEDDRTSYTEEGFSRGLLDHLHFTLGKDDTHATQHDRYLALAHTVRDRVMAKWMRTKDAYRKQDPKRVYYLSAEFLLGRALQNNLLSMGLYDKAQSVTGRLGLHLGDLLDQERDAGLGNGGLGRLAACYLDSMATLGLPAYGYGIRYEFGIFDQVIRGGAQIERPEEWLRYGSPWMVARPEFTQPVHFYGHTEVHGNGHPQVRWVDTTSVLGVPFDMPIVGYKNDTVNTLRLWSARASEEFDLTVFNAGDYERAVFDKNNSESISKVLYPNDLLVVGKELRLKQQYFFVACAIADLLRRHLDHAKNRHDPQAIRERLLMLPEKVAIQLNDTHPSIAIVELLRLLIDKYELPWDTAWQLTESVFAYTNHTLLPEALEVWSVELLGKLLPRHLQIIYEVNHRFLRQVWTNNPSDQERLQRMSLVQEQPFKGVRMAYLATLGSHKVNGVAELHSRLLREHLLPDFAGMFPDRFINVTNGVTPRRWLLGANPELAEAITRRIGDSWPTELEQLERLVPFAKDPDFQAEVQAIKLRNKQRLCEYIARHNHVTVDPHALFDVQVKRLHEYKRQLLNVLHIISLYQRLKQNPSLDIVPRCFLFGAKAAPGYTRAKLIIRLINAVADVVNHDPHVCGKLKVLFLANYRVSLAEKIIPAADLSEQISTAGFEASGTGNMKLSMNGALTIGTLDGANVEIRSFVGPENFFLFGLTADEVMAKKASYNPWDCYRRSPDLHSAIDLIRSGFFSYDEPLRYQPLLDALLPPEEKPGRGDPFLVLADFDAYAACQQAVDQAFRDPQKWSEMAIHNIARTGYFSSDRSVREYATKIWNARPVKVT
ncbi:MAG TPA: glycogen/starch/alpha-glucan phosphorylase [Pseudomonadota bacterium]|nr:glycogen/starch/alpha-glucan phosphorylase [Pseudomonadota bacterium]